MNTAVYDVEFPDGTTKEYGANVIAENLQDHRTNGTEVKMKDRHISTKRGVRKLRKTTVGWSFNVKC